MTTSRTPRVTSPNETRATGLSFEQGQTGTQRSLAALVDSAGEEDFLFLKRFLEPPECEAGASCLNCSRESESFDTFIVGNLFVFSTRSRRRFAVFISSDVEYQLIIM